MAKVHQPELQAEASTHAITKFADRSFTASEDKRAVKALALLQVCLCARGCV